MKLNTFFRKSIKKEISDWTNDILNGQWQSEISLASKESPVILDGKEIIFEFLDHNENGCAFEQLG